MAKYSTVTTGRFKCPVCFLEVTVELHFDEVKCGRCYVMNKRITVMEKFDELPEHVKPARSYSSERVR